LLLQWTSSAALDQQLQIREKRTVVCSQTSRHVIGTPTEVLPESSVPRANPSTVEQDVGVLLGQNENELEEKRIGNRSTDDQLKVFLYLARDDRLYYLMMSILSDEMHLNELSVVIKGALKERNWKGRSLLNDLLQYDEQRQSLEKYKDEFSSSELSRRSERLEQVRKTFVRLGILITRTRQLMNLPITAGLKWTAISKQDESIPARENNY